MKTTITYFIFLSLMIFTALGCDSPDSPSRQDVNDVWPVLKKEHKPGMYWWWMGSAVDRENITYNLENLHEAGIGGVTIVPIYGVKGHEQDYIDYLSPEWMTMLAHTVEEVKRLGMWADMTTGTGWPFGGSHITPQYAAGKIEYKKYSVAGGTRLNEIIDVPALWTMMAYSEKGQIINLADKLDENNVMDWIAPPGQWEVYLVWQTGTGQKVKRAAPGNMGLVIDPFSVTSLNYYLERFNMAFEMYDGMVPRAQYHDSFEYHHANWTNNFFEEFNSLRGYDLQDYLHLFLGETENEAVARVRADYQETLSDLHLEYIREWNDWAHDLGCITRNQAHGAPANLLDLYAAADIPETEIFGSTLFKIPGLRRDPQNIGRDSPNPLVLQFASSAAHITGKPLVASETCTWLRDHFKTALSQVKPEIDQLFLAGINHIFYHGNAYSPSNAEWPGWLFYASTHFEKENALWYDFPALNAYVTRTQSVLQSGEPDNDILLYWPIYDIWHNNDKRIKKLTVHEVDWFTETDFEKIATEMKEQGYTFDYISDRQLQMVEYKDGNLQTPGGQYKTIIIPECGHMPHKTWNKFMQLAAEGATILVNKNLPLGIPGFTNLEKRQRQFEKIISDLKFKQVNNSELKISRVGEGQILLGSGLQNMLARVNVYPETLAQNGIGFIRRHHSEGHYYFLSNLSDNYLNSWISINRSFESALILDPISSKSGVAATRHISGKSEIYLQLQPGESRIIKTFKSQKVQAPPWRYLTQGDKPFEVKGEWKINFIQGGPVLPDSHSTRNLQSWIKFPDEEAMRFAGTARYTISFEMPEAKNNEWILDLGRVCESARIKINGHEAGILWSIPFNLSIGEFLQKGTNILEIEVTNLSANRIADLDRRNIPWKKFHDINFVNIHYKKFDASNWPLMDSGLLGPVTLTPVKLIMDSELNNQENM